MKKKKGSREGGKFLCTNEYIYNSSNGQSFTDLSSRVDQFLISRRRFIFHCRRSFFRDRRSALLTNPSRSLSYNEFSLSRTRDVSFFPFFLFRKDTKTKTDRNFAHTCIRSEKRANLNIYDIKAPYQTVQTFANIGEWGSVLC